MCVWREGKEERVDFNDFTCIYFILFNDSFNTLLLMDIFTS